MNKTQEFSKELMVQDLIERSVFVQNEGYRRSANKDLPREDHGSPKIQLKEFLETLLTKQNPEIYIWVDIGSRFHYLFASIEGEYYALGEMTSDTQGFSDLNKIFDLIQNQQGNVYIAMESSGIYYHTLLSFLKKFSFVDTYVINAKYIKAYRESMGKQYKNDKLDARMITQYIRAKHHDNLLERDNMKITKENKPHLVRRAHYLEVSCLRSLYRKLLQVKKELSQIKVRIGDLEIKLYPEYRQVFSTKHTPLEIFLKKHFTKEKLITTNLDDLHRIVYEWLSTSYKQQRFKNTLKQLQELLKDSIGIQDPEGQYQKLMKMHLSALEYKQEELEYTNHLITTELERIEQEENVFVPNIPGMSKIQVGSFIAELGTKIYTDSISQLISFIGWHPVTQSSGIANNHQSGASQKVLKEEKGLQTVSDTNAGYLKKWWNRVIKNLIYMSAINICSMGGTKSDPVSETFRNYNLYKKDQYPEKQKKKRYGPVWSKLIRTVIACYKHRQNFSEKQAQAQSQFLAHAV